MIISNLTQDGTSVSNLSRGSNKRVLVHCDTCGTEKWIMYHNYLKSQEKHQGSTYCRPCSNRITGPKRKLIPFNKGKRMPRGENAPNWKGGTWISSDGYIMVRTESGVIRTSGWAQYRKRCHIVAEQKLGRELLDSERIHHIDLNKLNDNPDNIVVVERGQHRSIHNSLAKLSASLVQLGLIVFDTETATYNVAHLKLRELLEQPEVANQPPSLSSNALEGPETREASPEDDNPTSAKHQ